MNEDDDMLHRSPIFWLVFYATAAIALMVTGADLAIMFFPAGVCR